MNWNELIKQEVDGTYRLTQNLIEMVDEDGLSWKPSDENNWMTMGQLLMHITNACGMAMRGFVTGDWGMPEGMEVKDLPPEQMLPPAEKLPALGSVAEAKTFLEEDRQLALAMLAECDEDRLVSEKMAAPWGGAERELGYHLFQMAEHLRQHMTQLFYYLKLQGKPVNTGHLWDS